MTDKGEGFVIRPKVLKFAHLMETVLRENDWKGGWQDMEIKDILKRLHEELRELQSDIDYLRSHDSICKESVDVANFCMMMVDICGRLEK